MIFARLAEHISLFTTRLINTIIQEHDGMLGFCIYPFFVMQFLLT